MTAALRRYFATERTPGAVPELDGLRALAILLVLLRHATLAFPMPERIFPVGSWDAATPLRNGWAGVDLFFVLSGFLITFHLLRRWPAQPSAGTVGRYLAKRALRIVPAYYAWLLFVAFVPLPHYPLTRDHLGWRLAYHLAFLQDYLPADFVVAFWSLGVEEKFYLLAPLVIVPLLGIRHRAVPLAVLLLLAAAPLAARALVYANVSDGTYSTYFFALRSPFHMSADGLWIGSAAAFVYAAWDEAGVRPRGALFLVPAIAILGATLWTTPLLGEIGRFQGIAMGSVLAVGFGALLLGVLAGVGPRLRALLGSWPLLCLSRLSYSLYLVHMVFLTSVYAGLGSWLGWTGWSAGARFLLYAPALLIVCLAAAAVLHYTVEKPFLLLKDRL